MLDRGRLDPPGIGSSPPFDGGRPARQKPVVVRNAHRLLLAALSLLSLGARPNVVLVNLDDVRADGIDRMQVVQERLSRESLRFVDSFVTTPACWASRASILTGRYARHHGVQDARPSPAASFRSSENDHETIAVWFRREGYATGLFGKYINGYADERIGQIYYVPPGWDRWRVFGNLPHYGGQFGEPYTLVHEDHRARTHSAYSTDLLGLELNRFIQDASDAGKPFFAVWTPYASHVETPSVDLGGGVSAFLPVPAARHVGAMAELPPWRPPSYDQLDPGQPRWLEELQLALQWENRYWITDLARQRAYETLMAVDEQIEELLDLLERIGALEETIIVLTSDSGAGWGEHGLFFQLKSCPYDECIRVPLLIRYPEKLGPGESDRLTLNIDIAPLLLELAGLPIPGGLDGRPLSRGRGVFSIENFAGLSDAVPSWRGIRTRGHLLVRYATDEFEVYNLARDPHQLHPLVGHGAR